MAESDAGQRHQWVFDDVADREASSVSEVNSGINESTAAPVVNKQ